MQKTFCDDCGIDIGYSSFSCQQFGVSPTTNPQAATKFRIMVKIYPVLSDKLADICASCARQRIEETVVFPYRR